MKIFVEYYIKESKLNLLVEQSNPLKNFKDILTDLGNTLNNQKYLFKRDFEIEFDIDFDKNILKTSEYNTSVSYVFETLDTNTFLFNMERINAKTNFWDYDSNITEGILDNEIDLEE